MADDAAMAVSYDTIVVGLGAMGSCALEALARLGEAAAGVTVASVGAGPVPGALVAVTVTT